MNTDKTRRILRSRSYLIRVHLWLNSSLFGLRNCLIRFPGSTRLVGDIRMLAFCVGHASACQPALAGFFRCSVEFFASSQHDP
jgi:hypothetical protein